MDMQIPSLFNETLLRTIIESVPNGILLVDSLGKITLCNTEIEKMFGYAPSELLGKNVEVLVPISARNKHPAYRTDFSSHPSKRQMGAGRDLSGVRKDGSEIPVEIGLNFLNLDQRKYFLASVVDITQRKMAEEKLHKAYDEVRQKNIEMEQFVYTVSHDLKTPLVTSSSFISFLKEDLQEKNYDSVFDSMDRLEKAHHRMQELIEDLLQLSRAGTLELKYEYTDMRDLVTSIQESLADIIKEKNFEFTFHDLPKKVLCDRRRIYQVLENLINNALKYAADVEKPKIEIFGAETDKEIQICVKDRGPGVEPIYQKKIFGLFQRLDNSKEGTGVGLTIVSRIMQIHDGRCWIQSQPPEGCEFWIAFPKGKGKAYETTH